MNARLFLCNNTSLLEQGELSGEQREGLAMVRGDAELTDSLSMRFRGIALVLLPVIGRKAGGQFIHIVVTIGLGQDGGRSDAQVFAVTLHHRRMGNSRIGIEAVAINQQVIGSDLELIHRSVHR